MDKIDHIHLRRLDLNALVTFDAVMMERSVTRAAARLGLGQPAVSHTLSNLRNFFDDALFVRTRDGLEPTVRALEIHALVTVALGTIQSAASSVAEFHPATARRLFRIGTSDLFEVGLVPDILRAVAQLAPGVKVRTVILEPKRSLEAIDENTIDISMNVHASLAGWHEHSLLFEERYVCMFSPAQGVAPPLTLARYLAEKHAVVHLSPGRTSKVQEVLSRLDVQRNEAVWVSSYFSIGFLLHTQPLIATMPEILGQPIARIFNLETCPTPFEVPTISATMVWHKRNGGDPGLQWFRSLVDGVVRDRRLRHSQLEAADS